MGKARTEDSEERPAKRTRVSRACDQCRACREKCDGSQPSCQTCTSQDRDCTYNEAPKKRGIQPNYIRTLELLLAWSFDSSPDLQQHLSKSLPHIDGHVHRLLAGKDVEAAEKLHQSWRASAISRQIDQVLSGSVVETPSPRGDHPPSEQAQATRPDTAVAIPESNPRLQLPQNAWTLLDFYFAYIHSWMPMTEKANMMKLLYAYPATGIPIEQTTHSEHAELWSILAVASHLMSVNLDDSQNESARIRGVAEMLVPSGKTYEVPHLKAMILLTLIDMSEQRTLDAWLRVGTVVRILSLFKLLEELDGTTRWCKHVHLAAFVIESSLALRMNAKSHLTPSYIENVGFIDEDGRDEWDPWNDPLASNSISRAPARSFSTLNRLVRAYMHHVTTETFPSGAAASLPDRDIVFELLRNASLESGRLQPAVFLEQAQRAKDISASLVDDVNLPNTSPDWPTNSRLMTKQSMPQEFLHLSIPNDDFTEIDTNVGVPSVMDGPATDSMDGGDIFQELAMLERTDTSNQFMENLGFAADLDLQEFFGDAYQASDPTLSLMQANSQFG